MTVCELLRATREFYTKRRKQWTQGYLRSGNRYCVLGAMTAVVADDDDFDLGGNVIPPTRYCEDGLLPNAAEILIRANRGSVDPRIGDSLVAATNWNDSQRSRKAMLAGLRKAEKLAKELGV